MNRGVHEAEKTTRRVTSVAEPATSAVISEKLLPHWQVHPKTRRIWNDA